MFEIVTVDLGKRAMFGQTLGDVLSLTGCGMKEATTRRIQLEHVSYVSEPKRICK